MSDRAQELIREMRLILREPDARTSYFSDEELWIRAREAALREAARLGPTPMGHDHEVARPKPWLQRIFSRGAS